MGQALTATGILIELRIPPPRAIALVAREAVVLDPFAHAVSAGAEPLAALRAAGPPVDHACLAAIDALHVAGGTTFGTGWLLRYLGRYISIDGLFAGALEREPADRRLSAARFLHALSLMIGVGRPLVDALETCAATPAFEEIAEDINAIIAAWGRGVYWGTIALEIPSLFSVDVSEGILLGELSGTLDAVLADMTNDTALGLSESLGAKGPSAMMDEAHRLAASCVRREIIDLLQRISPVSAAKHKMLGRLGVASLVAALDTLEGR